MVHSRGVRLSIWAPESAPLTANVAVARSAPRPTRTADNVTGAFAGKCPPALGAIVRTIVPGANTRVPAGAPVTLSAVLVGRGADLAAASLSIDGADAAAQVDKRSARDWTIHASRAVGSGNHTVHVLVRDASGAAGGFTWQFLVGAEEATPVPSP